MIDKDVALAGLSALCNANVTSIQKLRAQGGAASAGTVGGPAHQQLFVSNFISSVLDADETCEVSRNNFDRLKRHLEGDALSWGPTGAAWPFAPLFGFATRLFGTAAPSPVIATPPRDHATPPPDHVRHDLILDEDEFFEPGFDYDFRAVKDTVTYYRGEEEYQRPCGWKRFAIKVLDKYSDGNTWLGNPSRSTKSVPGEWPVSYHGTSQRGAARIIEGFYESGDGDTYGRGIYSTPDISEADTYYAKTFNEKGQDYKVILQNRINPEIRKVCEKAKYWLISIPAGTSKNDEQKMVERAIRPYGLLLKEV
ncbi:uncharacterized protein LOC119023741 isoform X1 [Acanthopagrus latus]|uniref:uncharacterized protein LOC119023741 isoform X1 n=1 Tax=Acanthopagrus latus TaxID=8177 RepID=UPI00187C062A|nr:uncharacterized protein LOC119023741 isoform X1 [Acanthopagrus latus]XP_036961746.1 uncharacterized protein LOC119023741 isoform X1 [Acanthopagrus latus]